MKYGNIRGEVDGTYQLVGETYIDGAYAQYKMDENAANMTVDDSGYGANGATSSTNTSNLASSGAFDFTSASSEYVNIDNLETDIINDTVGTFSCWVNPDTVASLQYVWCFGDTNSGEFIDLSINASGNIIFETSAGGWKATGGTTLSTGTWYHIVTGQDGSAPFVYINGVRETLTFSFTTNIDRWFSAYVGFIDNGRIGCRNYQNSTNQDFYDGQIDDLRYYKYPLTGAQVTEIYNSGTVDEDVVMTEPTQTIEFTGLDGDNDEEYELYVKHWGDGDLNCYIGTASGYLGVYGRQACYVLADTSPSNLQSANTSNGAFIQIGNTDQGEGNWSVVNIQTPKGLPKSYLFKSAYDIHDDTSPPSTWLQGGPIDLTLESNNANITRIKVISSLSGGLQEGTHVILMKKVNNDAMKVGDIEVNGRALTEPPDPYAYYKMDETSGTTVKDYGYGANDGTLSDDASNHTQDGIIDRSLYFDTSQRIVADNLCTDIASDTVGSFSFWVYPTSAYTGRILNFTGTANNNQLDINRASTGVVNFVQYESSTTQWQYATSASDCPLNTWTHFVVSQDGISPKIYINGVLDTNGSFTVTTNKTKWLSSLTVVKGRLLSYYHQPSSTEGESFYGRGDEFRYYKYALEEDQAEQLYKLGVPDARATVYGMWEKIKEVNIDGPFCHMKMEDSSDTGSGANAVTEVGSPTYTAGKIGNALTLDGTTPDYLSCTGLFTDIKADEIGTFSCWFYVDGSGNQCLFSLGDVSAAGTYFAIRTTNGNINVNVRSGGTFSQQLVTGNTVISQTTWHHLVVTQDGVSGKIYVDGDEVAWTNIYSGDGDWIADADDGNFDVCYIGKQAYNGSVNFNGKIDDLRYYQRVLSAREVSDIYNEGNGSQSAVANQTSNSINFTALDGDTDCIYKIITKCKRDSGVGGFGCRPNGDAGASSFAYSYIEGSNTTASAHQDSTYSYFYLGGIDTVSGGMSTSEAYIYARSGRPRAMINNQIIDTSTTVVGASRLTAGVWFDIGENITNMAITTSASNQFGIGSTVELWRLNLQESY